MPRRSFFLLGFITCSLFVASAAAFDEPNQPVQPTSPNPGGANAGSSFGFDTAPSARPESYSAAAYHCMPPSYFFTMPTYKQHPSHVRRVVQSYGYNPGFAPDADSPYSYSVTGASLGWGNAGVPFGHMQYPGWGYPLASPSAFGF